MKTKDIEKGKTYRVQLGRVERSGGTVDPLQTGFVLARVEDTGSHIDMEAYREGHRRFNEGKKTIKVTVTRGLSNRTDTYGNAAVGTVRYLTPQQVLIEAEEGDAAQAAREEGFRRQREERARAIAEMQPTADRLNAIQVERGLTTTDYRGVTVPILQFAPTDYGSLTYSRNTSTADAKRLIEALESIPIPEEVA